MNLSLTKRPSAYLPVTMSLAALSLVLGYVAVYGFRTGSQSQDEGAAAHLFQLLMVLQAPIMLFFALKWLPREPRGALTVLALQFGAWCAALGTLFLFEKVLKAI
jgi:CDP-diglyceride synthetase